jgi:hypothetical protein
MNSDQEPQNTAEKAGELQPWYRQFWPWFIIALPASAVIASFVTLWLAISNPDHLVVDEDEYQQLRSELKAQAPDKDNSEGTPDSEPN